ncbi:MAG: hypothetical protein B6242_08160 [Anaerolineaceae bacterium 4572_78]|nr:MAG: hypothetical protein B6242_08160 [Anaerolineaceae bacterium 4572_78]
MSWLFVIILCLIILLLLIYWQFIIAEGTYLGQGVVTFLYDWYALQYDAIKEFDEADEITWLGLPLFNVISDDFEGIILDVATGTGRLPRVMNRIPNFKGNVIGLDYSKKMIMVARQHVPGVPMVIADAMHLPFADESIPVVSCLEAMEFFPVPAQCLEEMVRVLAPHGVLLTTNRIGWETKFLPHRTWSAFELLTMLDQMPLMDIAIIPWENIYDQVWARKKELYR